ncbi:MAG: class I SAM-dependent methyltransferase [Chloroflexi bacterium]|nr:class I SAM-dependent methyltransferase [Chloroflexota bacterium]
MPVASAFDRVAWIYDFVMDGILGHYEKTARIVWAALGAPVQPLLLDMGGGTGGVSAHLIRRGARVVLLELAPSLLRRCPPGVVPLLGDGCRLPLADASVDGALVVLTLHHMADPDRALEERARVVRPGGVVVVIEKAPPAAGDVRGRVVHWAEQLLFGPLRCVPPAQLQARLEAVGFAPKHLFRFGYVIRARRLPVAAGHRGPVGVTQGGEEGDRARRAA